MVSHQLSSLACLAQAGFCHPPWAAASHLGSSRLELAAVAVIGTTTTYEQSHIVWSGKTPQLESRPISAFCFSTHVSEFFWLESEQTIVPGWRNDRCVPVSTTQTSFWGRWRPDDGGERGCLHPQNKQCDLGLSGSGLWLGWPLKEISNFPLLPFTLCRHLLSPKPGPEASKE